MIRAKGSLDFLRREAVVGIALSVLRTYLGGQFACGDGVTEDYGKVRLAYMITDEINDLHLVEVLSVEEVGRDL